MGTRRHIRNAAAATVAAAVLLAGMRMGSASGPVATLGEKLPLQLATCSASGTLYGFDYFTPDSNVTKHDIYASLGGTCSGALPGGLQRSSDVALTSVNAVSPGSPLFLGTSCAPQTAFIATLTLTDPSTGAQQYQATGTVQLTYPAASGSTSLRIDAGTAVGAGTLRNSSGCPAGVTDTSATATFRLAAAGSGGL